MEGVMELGSRFRSGVGLVAVLAVAGFGVLTLRADAVSDPPDAPDSSFVPMSPCRLFDTRPEFDLGSLATFGADDTQTVTAHGDSGECTIPDVAVALSLNVTAVNATLPTHVTVWPDGEMPTASSLNPVPGGVAFNAVTVPLASGAFQVYNFQGSLDVIADVNGYYRPAVVAPVVASGRDEGPLVIDTTPRDMLSIGAVGAVGYDGLLVVHYSVNVEQAAAGAVVECRLENTLGSREPVQRWESPGSLGGTGTISGSGTFSFSGEFGPSVELNCWHSGAVGPTLATDVTMQMTAYPSEWNPYLGP